MENEQNINTEDINISNEFVPIQDIQEIITKPHKKLEFSKMLAILISVIFVGTWIVGWGCWVFTQALPNELLDYISSPFMVVITGYFAKAGVENVVKYKN